ncbi:MULTISPECIES: DUF6489 family protein [unclassified Haematospirillum]|uniref:DUF6489 family protein n=1 Tax=unclassified Haematospirillum TaxID=2622088 RepID=UPI00143AE1E6|nr:MULTISPECIES: DUF6489 family protein [unclassified Haematospirillum]NKD55568.1 hypothetical protein [Haematospirillum sp. H4890]NKD75707.1 hypothetical protein [Haematospirillum sp. H4485]NKD88301.1 hypothetical protein [Haematospirillum sp. 15-248]
MKIEIDIDCTPEEARTFLGLPDVRPMQDALLAEIHKQMMNQLQAVDPDTLMKSWLPAQVQGLEQMQKFFWSHFTGDDKSGNRGP